jgi:hypothetical protein
VVVATATTDADGFYFIDDLSPGDYYATFTLPEGYAFTTATAGGDGTVDSDAVVTVDDVLVGQTAVFTIAASVTGDTVADTDGDTVAVFVNPTIDAGVVPVEPEEPPVDPEDPPVDPEDPPVDPEDPPVDPDEPPTVDRGEPPIPLAILAGLDPSVVVPVGAVAIVVGLLLLGARRRRSTVPTGASRGSDDGA